METDGARARGDALRVPVEGTQDAGPGSDTEPFVSDKTGFMRDFAVSLGTPEYPAASLEEGIGGPAVVAFVVDVDGRVTDVDVLESPDERIAAAVRKVLTQASFQPVSVRGRGPIAVHSKLVFYFDPQTARVRLPPSPPQ